MDLKNIKSEEIKDYIQKEKAKGRSVEDIIKEVVALRNDVALLSGDPVIAEQQILKALKKTT